MTPIFCVRKVRKCAPNCRSPHIHHNTVFLCNLNLKTYFLKQINIASLMFSRTLGPLYCSCCGIYLHQNLCNWNPIKKNIVRSGKGQKSTTLRKTLRRFSCKEISERI
ncbi:hypothetical protein ACOSQ4_013183 [Xanthoceras sorbifolium]